MNKPDFSGTWKFNPNRSRLQIEPPESTVFVLDHREPLFRISRTHVFRGKRDTFELQLSTDGKEVTGEHGTMRFRSRAYWEGDVLIFESNIETAGGQGTNTVRYRLDGDSLVAEEHLRSTTINYDNVWVLEKEPRI